jgi:hypothetical protein
MPRPVVLNVGEIVVADELWLIGHDDRTGGSRLHPGALGYCLAAALIGELVLAGWLRVYRRQVSVRSVEPVPDELAADVLRWILRDPASTDLQVWLSHWAQATDDRVTARLIRAGIVERGKPGLVSRLAGRRGRPVPVDSTRAWWAAGRLAQDLRRGRRLDDVDTLLAGLVAATGLHKTILALQDPIIAESLDTLLGGLNAAMSRSESESVVRSSLAELVGHVAANIAGEVASGVL